MRRSLSSEMLKLITTRGTVGLLVGEIAVALLAAVSTVASAKSESLVGAIHEQVFFLLISINIGIFSLILGMRTVTDEFRYGTIVHSFLADPSRRRTALAKAISAGTAAAVFAGIAAVTAIAAAVMLASLKGGALVVDGSDMAALAGFILANALWGVIGVGVGSIVRHQVPAIVGGIVWVLVVENLGAGFLGEAGRYLPGQAAYALSRALDQPDALPATVAGGVLALYALAVFGSGLLFMRRRDVV